MARALSYFSLTSTLVLASLFLPVFLGAISPTFLPGGAFLEVLVDLPGCWCLPPPNGWYTTAMAMPLILGYILPWAFIAWCLGPARMNGLSSLPPPAISPIDALHLSSTRMLLPEGSLRIALPFPLENRTAEPPEARTSFPPSPTLSSMFDILVPSGMLPRGSMFPFEGAALGPRPIWLPTTRPLTAGM